MLYQFIFLLFGLSVAVSATIQTRKISPKIVGGIPVNIGILPYQVSLQYNGYHICGGSIIHHCWILTAAHCVRERTAANYSVRAGSSIIYTGGQVIQVSKIVLHHLYKVNAPNKYDVALLKLEKPLKINKCVEIIHLSDSKPKVGSKLIVSGWGRFKEESPYSTVLQVTRIPVVSKDKCYRAYKNFHLFSDFVICASFGRGRRDAYQGDSGGPARVNNKLVGIVSWGRGCGWKNIPAVYLSVAPFKSWIESQIS